MSEFFFQYGLFFAEVFTFIFGILFLTAGMIAIAKKDKSNDPMTLEIKSLNDKYHEMKQSIEHHVLTKEKLKENLKLEKKEIKQLHEAQNKGQRHKTYVLDFDGDIKASAVDELREAISAVLSVAEAEDEVLLKLESPGGLVHSYGLAASQLTRLKQKNVKLIIAVDKIAASGGYLMAAVADKIIAAPFAILGSIGVLAQIPNFNKLLKKLDIDYEQHTAGEYKRTLSMFGKNTVAARNKFQEELDDTHELFKAFLLEHREQLDMNVVATGEHWYGLQALNLNLIDGIKTSDDFILEACEDRDVYEISVTKTKSFMEKFSANFAMSINQFMTKIQSL